MLTRSTLRILVLLAAQIGATAGIGFAQQPEPPQSNWRATVACESLVVYSQMDARSRVAGHLKKGDLVSIDLEIIGAGGSWSSVTEFGKRFRMGYAPSVCLEREQREPLKHRQARPLPPVLVPPRPEPVREKETEPNRPTKEEIEREVDRALAARLGGLLLEANKDQTSVSETHSPSDATSFLFIPGLGRHSSFFPRSLTHFPVRPAPRFFPSVQIHSGPVRRK